MEGKGIEIHNYEQVRKALIGHGRFDLVEWLDNNRVEYTRAILNREHHFINFYYEWGLYVWAR